MLDKYIRGLVDSRYFIFSVDSSNTRSILCTIISKKYLDRFRVVASLNHLKYSQFDELKNVCPTLQKDSEPGSIYLQVVG